MIKTRKRVTCDSCQLVRIQGVVCHEIGCPDAWEDQTRKCLWCGQDFKPKYREQTCCDEGCRDSYYRG